MPSLPRRPCRVMGCPNTKPCAVHGRRSYNQASSSARGYGYAWNVRAKAFLRAHPTCVMCGGPAQVADHVIPRRAGGSDDESNLQALCRSDHNRKTGAVDRVGPLYGHSTRRMWALR